MNCAISVTAAAAPPSASTSAPGEGACRLHRLHPARLEPGEQHQLDTLTALSPQLGALRVHVRQFAEMMINRRGRDLEAWINAVLRDDLSDLHSFVTGLRRDFDAAKAGLTLSHSSGKVKGHVNRVKMLKRQMYGRANPDLLRKRLLLAD